ncbi:TadE/TadG family type IV pilus assembly protein [Mycoplana ramosa]|uniref:TadE/TadG family type IV pilus assembly protein n=1 Tax=Mycoplana ramosa TaxID=40837 RepID=UPI00366F6A93
MTVHGDERTHFLADLMATLRRLAAAREGVGAVEFAILVPLLLVAYIGAYETSVAMSFLNKVGRASATISDVLTQGQTVSVEKDMEGAATDIALNIIAPFTSEDFGIKVTGVQVDDAGTATVAWYWQNAAATGSTPAKGDPFPLAADMRMSRSFYVQTELSMKYEYLLFLREIAWRLQDPTFRRTSLSRVRKGDTISCTMAANAATQWPGCVKN